MKFAAGLDAATVMRTVRDAQEIARIVERIGRDLATTHELTRIYQAARRIQRRHEKTLGTK